MSSSEETPSEKPPVLHVVVVGFHHKKGCQVEYSYPPLISGGSLDSHDLPDEWRHLPSMALPDGSHNHLKDTIYFHLPSIEESHKTVYGVSCYRQMDAKDLVNKTSDVTRSSVQKSVCVLSRLPLYGLIQAKLELITHAYFDERDFTKVELLRQTYTHLNSTLSDTLMNESRIYLGLSPREIVHLFKHKIVLLLKLLLLERRVLFSGGPVEKLCSILLSVVSLVPGMLEYGLEECSNYSLQNQLSPTLKLANFGIDMEDYLEISYKDVPNHKNRKRERSEESNTETKQETIQTINQTEELSKGNNSVFVNDCDFLKTTECTTQDPLGVGIHVASVRKTDKNHGNVDIKGDKISSSVPENGWLKNKEECVNTIKELCKDAIIENPDNKEIEVDNILDPLRNIEKITRVEPLQIGSSNEFDRDHLFSDESPQLSPNTELNQDGKNPLTPLDLSKVTNVNRELSKKRDIITDIDSPESITEIDKEDGFHWEEDKLLLEIDQELENNGNSVLSETESRQQAISGDTVQSTIQSNNDLSTHSSSPQQPSVQTIERTDSTEQSITGLVETSDEDGTYRIITKVQLTTQTGNKNTNGAVQSSPRRSAKSIRNKLSHAFSRESKEKLSPKGSNSDESPEPSSTNLQQDEFGFPLAIFTKGCLCHPYLCLQYYDLLQDVNVKSFLIGATNVLFKQKRHLTDIIIDVTDGKIDISETGLRRQLQLTTADLRFADVLVKAVSEEENTFLEGTEWEGGDQWLRAQFKSYLLGLLTATQLNDEHLLEDYGMVYVNAWRLTNNHRVWTNTTHPALDTLQPGHPCQGNLSVNDIRVRFTSAMQGSERGRKINSAVSQTGKYVAQTSRAVGGALSQAKSSVTSWISNWKL